MQLKTKNHINIRTILTIIGVVIGAASVMIISEIGNLGGIIIEKEIDKLGFNSILVGTESENYPQAPLADKELELILNEDNVSFAAPFIFNYSKAQMRGLIAKTAICGIESGNNQIISLELLHGRFFSKNDIKLKKKVCIVDENMAFDFYKRKNIVGKKIILQMNGIEKEFEIVGVVKSGGTISSSIIASAAPYLSYIPYTTLLSENNEENFNKIAVKTFNTNNSKNVMANLVKKLEEENNLVGAYTANDLSNEKQQLENIIFIVKTILSAIAGISLIVSGLSIMTVMLIRVKERTREIGIKKAVGAKKGSIITEFILDSLKITFTGSSIGIIFSAIIIKIATVMLKIDYIPDIGTICSILSFTLVIGIFFGAYPAYTAASLEVVKALQSE